MSFKVALAGFIGWLLAVGVCAAANRISAAAGMPLPISPLLATNMTANHSAKGADSSNPYAVIIERNVFHLNPEPPPPEPEVPKPVLPEIKISGFLKVGSRTRALFAEVPKNPKDRWSYFSLYEGERDGILELVRILPDRKEAEVINSGTRMVLTLKDNGFSPTPSKGHAEEAGRVPRRELPAYRGSPGRGQQRGAVNFGAASGSASSFPRKRL